MIEELKCLSLFSGINHNILNRLIQEKQIYKQIYYKGVTVHEQNAGCSVIDVVCSGRLVAYSLATNGSETIVFEFGTGSVIGANLLFGGQNRYPMSIYCTEDCGLLHISKFGIEQLLKEYNFMMQFIKSLSLNSQGMNRKITMYTQKSLRENLMDYLLALSTQQKSESVLLPITKKQLADYLGVQRPSLFRELKRMKDEGLIQIVNKRINIKFV
ncbi:MAG: Crp/Fnr family transcriptional regulator [Lacrimispora celerecrescens]|nr:Crp/Fnr family transcriptional regulator [Lacrimispora celerecrescens]